MLIPSDTRYEADAAVQEALHPDVKNPGNVVVDDAAVVNIWQAPKNTDIGNSEFGCTKLAFSDEMSDVIEAPNLLAIAMFDGAPSNVGEVTIAQMSFSRFQFYYKPICIINNLLKNEILDSDVHLCRSKIGKA